MEPQSADRPGPPAVEVAIVKLRPGAGPGDRARVERRLAASGAEAVLVAGWGWIVRLPEAAKSTLRSDPAVALVGGVQPGGREIPRIRVPSSGVSSTNP